MTGMGEEVYIDPTIALDALTAESERLGLYGAAPGGADHFDGVSKMVDEASLDVPLETLVALRAGKLDSLLTTWECLGAAGGWVPPSHPLHHDNPDHGTRKVPVGVVDALKAWRANPTDDNAYMLRLFCDSWKEAAR